MRIKNWETFSFILSYHILLVALLPFVVGVFSWAAAAIFLVTFIAGGLSITAGYHRLFSHRAYSAHPVYEWAVLILSTLGVQWSALMWSHDHRLHHNHVDGDKDPYAINKGFWYAHILWLFDYRRDYQPGLVGDLLKNPRVVFQDRYYVPLTLFVNAAVFGIGCLFMHPLASFYAGVVLRIFAIHHCTWFINSLAHTWGARTYARELSAVDNAFMALLTFGEGYHNYHHVFAGDYRNGVRWYHFDPTKWLVWTASKLGITGGLRTVDQVRIQKKLVTKDKELLLDRLNREFDELAVELRERVEALSARFEENSALLMERMKEFKAASKERREALKNEIRRLRREVRSIWKEWLDLTRTAASQYALAH